MARKTTKRDLIITSVLSVVMSIICFYAYFLKDDTKETYSVHGVFNAYKNIESTKSVDHYFVSVDHIQYDIPSIYFDAFDEAQFLQQVKVGDSLRLEVTESKSIHQITDSKTNYINTDKRTSSTQLNFKVALVLGIASLLAAVFMFYNFLRMPS